jgi:predicted nuclease of predicted toxin-antitoxin system
MKFLLDQDVYAATTRFLRELGHDVLRVAELGLSQAADEELLQISEKQGRILVTRDRDYGALVFVKSMGSGVIYLRVLPSTQDAVHQELAAVLGEYAEAELQKTFIVVRPSGHRIRRPFQKRATTS